MDNLKRKNIMNKRMPPNRGPRPGPQLQSKAGPDDKNSKYGYRRRRWCPPYYDYDYDWYDYDWYDYYDYDNYLYTPPKRSKGPSGEWETEMDPVQEAYRQGFKDGWAAAIDAMYYSGEGNVEPVMPEPMPQPPMPEPTPMSK